MRRSLVLAGVAAAACAAAGAPLHAQGSSVDSQSACQTARTAGVAMPCDDGSSVWFNPAAMSMNPSAVSLGVALIRTSNEFRFNPDAVPADGISQVDREPETIPVPQAYINYRVNERLAVGLAALAPYGLGLKWPETFEGRFTGYDNSLRGVYIQPTASFQVIPGRLMVGAGVDYVRGSIDVSRRQFGPAALGLGTTEVADVNLAGDGDGWTYHVGGLLRLGEGAYLGARYLGEAEIDLDGDAEFTQVSTGNPLVDAAVGASFPENQGVATQLTFPSQVTVGLGVKVHPRVNLMADFQRTHWSSFDAFDLDFETQGDEVLALGYSDANTFRIGGEVQATDALVVRAGFRYNEAATPRATPLLPEGERNYYNFGLGYRVSRALSADFGFNYINQPDRRGATIAEGPESGVYSSSGMVFGFTLAYRFGGFLNAQP